MERPPFEEIDFSTKPFLKSKLQSCLIEQTECFIAGFVDIEGKVDVRILAHVTACE